MCQIGTKHPTRVRYVRTGTGMFCVGLCTPGPKVKVNGKVWAKTHYYRTFDSEWHALKFAAELKGLIATHPQYSLCSLYYWEM